MSKPAFSTFWTGRASPYQTLCLSSWVARGHDVIVYTIDDDIVLPAGVERRPARDVLDLGGRIYRYKRGFGAGSPALHANLFRYILLSRGETWLDADVVMVADTFPDGDTFLAWQSDKKVGNAIMRLPMDSPLIPVAIDEARTIAENPEGWGKSGPLLVTKLVEQFGLADSVLDCRSAYAIDHKEALMFFDPACREAVEDRVRSSIFVHFWNQIWRNVGVPEEIGPPEGSYLDGLIRKYGMDDRFKARLPIKCIKLWWHRAHPNLVPRPEY